MRCSLLSATLPLCFAAATVAQSQVSDELRDEIRRIIREEIRAAMKEHHAELAKSEKAAKGEKKTAVIHGFDDFGPHHPVTFSAPSSKTVTKAYRMVDGGKFEEVELKDLKADLKTIDFTLAEPVGHPVQLEIRQQKPMKLEVKKTDLMKAGAKKAGVMVLQDSKDGKVIQVTPAKVGDATECQIECVVECDDASKKALAECCKALEAVEECCEAVKGAKGEQAECCEAGKGEKAECCEAGQVECVDVVVESKPAKAAKKAKSKDKKKSKKSKAGAEPAAEAQVDLKISEVLEKLSR